jgi:LuxR family transcriptional regulator, maltose regulon positive regulatory protein
VLTTYRPLATISRLDGSRPESGEARVAAPRFAPVAQHGPLHLACSDAEIATRLLPPAVADGALVERPRLLERIARANAPLTLLAAPAGYGKTTLLAQYLGALAAAEPARGGLHAWLTLDAADDCMLGFVRALAAAIEAVLPLPRPSQLSARALLDHAKQGGEVSIPVLRATLLNDLASLPAPLTLALDDYQHIRSPEIHHTVALLAEQRPGGLRLLVASRSLPALPLARMRARRQLLELGEGELRYSYDEAVALLEKTLGEPPAPAELDTLYARSEGWPVGLQLAALSMAEGAGRRDCAAVASGSNRYIADYLEVEVLDQLPSYLREFLLRTSLLDELSGPLCDALLLDRLPSDERGAFSQLVLDELERARLFLSSLDGERRRYRYHPMFREALRAQLLAGASATEVAELRARAARWSADSRAWQPTPPAPLAATPARQGAGVRGSRPGARARSSSR